MNIAILIQIGNIDIFLNIINIISFSYQNYNIFYMFSFISLLQNKHLDIITHLEKNNIKNYNITYHENKGMDIGPYLLQLKYLFENYNLNSFDAILKIHTKTNDKWRNELIDAILNINLEILKTNKIIGSKKWTLLMDNLNIEHINKICNDFNIKNIFYDKIKPVIYNDNLLNEININFYSEYFKLVLSDCSALNNLLGYDINKKYIYEHMIKNKTFPSKNYILEYTKCTNLTFIGGTIFLIDYKIVWDFFNKINILELYNLLEVGYTINDKSTYVHALERIISGFVFLYL